jgi:hypothetical protein
MGLFVQRGRLLSPNNLKNGIDMIQQNPESASVAKLELAQQEKII